MAVESTSPPQSFDVDDFFIGPSTIDIISQSSTIASWSKMGSRSTQESSSVSSITSTCKLSSLPTSLARTSINSDHEVRNVEHAQSATNRDVPPEDGFLALGIIELSRREDDASMAPRWLMRGHDCEHEYPNKLMTMGQARNWIKVDDTIRDVAKEPYHLRVYAMPEDVHRTHRGSLKEFRKVIQFLLRFIDRTPSAWVGGYNDQKPKVIFEAPHSESEESLFYIFNTLRSPSPNIDCLRTFSPSYQAVMDVMDDSILGMKTQLYSYQRRSVAAMVQRESDPANLIDPRVILTNDMYGKPFYIDVHDGTLLESPPLYREPRGGILAETMGYGKTLICIALILATKGHYPKVPEDRIDRVQLEPRPKVATLLSMAARKIKHDGIPWKSDFYAFQKEGLHYNPILDELSKYNRAYAEPIFNPTTPNRKGKRESANIIHLCSGTLVIVPPNLLIQWQQEIRKHVDDDALDVLSLDSNCKEIPSWEQLLNYDVILITKARFEQEYRDDDLNQGHSKKGCLRYESPLTKLRWLRVICDEGHGFAGSSCRTNAMAMLGKMFVERRWVVSGTPSSSLHGVEVGLLNSDSTSSDSLLDSNTINPAIPFRRHSINTALQKRKAPDAHHQEAKDLDRLRLMVVRFLRLQPWANNRGADNADWKKYVVPSIDESGNRRTPLALREVLQTLIIRHRIEDIDTDLTLPSLHSKIVYLKPSYHDKLAINMFMLVLASNYVTSEREDEDYMFHPRNRKKFDLLVNNLRQASFHWVGFSEHDISETLRISDEYLDKHIDTIDDADGVMLTEAIMNAQRALADSSWVAFSKLHEIGVFVSRFPKPARQAWAIDSQAESPVLLGTVQAREAQKFYKDHIGRGSLDPLSGLVGKGLNLMRAARAAAEEEQKDKKHSKTSEYDTPQLGATEEPRLRVSARSSTSTTRSTSTRPKTTPRKRRNSSVDMSPIARHSAGSGALDDTITHSEPLSTRISGFTSSKLAYLMDQLLLHSSTSKSIIFYSSNNTAFWTAEALELMRIPFLIYANTLSVVQRNNYLSLFNSDDSIRVLLMDLKQASHGLHIASANRVYIIAPIWDKGVESQAIKRAHRIGQTKDVYVETLVLEGTFEEEMVKRRQDIDQNGSDHLPVEIDIASNLVTGPVTDQHGSSIIAPIQKSPKPQSGNNKRTQSLLDDRHMVQVLKDIKFLKFTEDEDRYAAARMARLTAPREQRMFFSMPSITDDGSPASERKENIDETVQRKYEGLNVSHDESSKADITRPVAKKARVAVSFADA